MTIKRTILLLLFSFLALLGLPSVLAININEWNVTYRGIVYNETFSEITNQNSIVFECINAAADAKANWSLVLWNDTNSSIINISLASSTQNLAVNINNTPPPIINVIDVSDLQDGQYYINLTAIDPSTNNSKSVKVMNLIIDRTPPAISVNLGGYTSGTWTNQSVNATITINESNLLGAFLIRLDESELIISNTEYNILDLLNESKIVINDTKYDIKNLVQEAKLVIGSEEFMIIDVINFLREAKLIVNDKEYNILDILNESKINIDIDERITNIISILKEAKISINNINYSVLDLFYKSKLKINNTIFNATKLLQEAKILINGAEFNIRDILHEAKIIIRGEIINIRNNLTEGTYSVTFSDEGTYFIKVIAIDAAGNFGVSGLYEIKIDKTSPEISVDLGEYQNNTWTNQNVAITITINESNLKEATLIINNNSIDITEEILTGEGKYSKVFSDEGIYTVVVIAEDNAGNSKTSGPYEIKIDKTSPEISVIFPKNNTIYGREGWGLIKINLTDVLSGIDSSTAKIILDGEEYNLSKGNDYYHYNISIEDLGTGWHNLTISVSDNAGNNKSIEIRFGIDITEPYVKEFKVSTIYENVLRGRVNIKFSAEDNFTNIIKVECYAIEKESNKRHTIFSKEYNNLNIDDGFEWDSIAHFGYEEVPIIIECYFVDSKNNKRLVSGEYILRNSLLPDVSVGGITAGGVVTTTDISSKLKKIGIYEIIEEIVPVENIKKVYIEKEEKIALDEERAEKILNIIKNYVERELPENVEIKIIPKKEDIAVKLIKLDCKKETIYLTKFEKEASRNVIIHIPKKIAEKAGDIIFIKGRIVKIYKEDPIIEVSPEEGKIEYVVEGNKIEFADEIHVYEYEIEEKEVEEKVTKEEKVTEEKEEIYEKEKEEKTVPIWYIIYKGGKKGEIAVWYIPLIIVLIGIAVFLFLKYRRRS